MESLARNYIVAGTNVVNDLKEAATPGCKHCHGRGYTGYEIKKDRYITCKCVKQQARAKLPMEGGLTRVEQGTIRRLRDEIGLLQQKASKLGRQAADNDLHQRILVCQQDVDREIIEINRRRGTAMNLQLQADSEQLAIVRKQARIKELNAEIRTHRVHKIENLSTAAKLVTQAHKQEETSRSQGLQMTLNKLTKRLHQQNHPLHKKAREALAKAEKLQAKLDVYGVQDVK